jgi:hypothetical protein
MSPDRYAGLPADLAPPIRTAQAIARLDRVEERERLFGRVPRAWQGMIRHYAVLAIAARIVETPGLEARRRLIGDVPEEWRGEVRAHVLRLWRVGELRAADQAQAA